jgi:hypothetical protein
VLQQAFETWLTQSRHEAIKRHKMEKAMSHFERVLLKDAMETWLALNRAKIRLKSWLIQKLLLALQRTLTLSWTIWKDYTQKQCRKNHVCIS